MVQAQGCGKHREAGWGHCFVSVQLMLTWPMLRSLQSGE